MPSFIERIPAALLLLGASSLLASAQMPSATPVGPRVEPGLEVAVKWIWKVEPSSTESWGLPLPDFPTPTPPPAPPLEAMPGSPGTFIPRATLAAPQVRPDVYTVKKGDSLYVIGRRYKVSVASLKQANGLTTNNIRVGLELKIPPPDELPPMAASPGVAAAGPKPHKTKTTAAAPEDLSILTMQVFLDRQQFSVGPIDGQISPAMQKAVQLYQDAHPELKDPVALTQKAQATVGIPVTQYILKPEDFRFIAPPKAEAPDASAAAATTSKGKKHKAEAAILHQPKATYHDLISAPMLAYRTPWEFVAERFHCNEAYLQKLNPQVRGVPTFGTMLRVPNVIPFEIESALNEPLQPQPDAQNPVSAAVVDLSRLEISQGGALIAVMPLSMARPGLKGKDPWTILNAIPRPMLATMHELRVKPQPIKRMFGRETAGTAPVPASTPVPTEDIIAAGPNNPVGIIWINLARSGTTEPLPYGLHGTSVPDQMMTQQSLGGLRLTNWDIARAVHLLPSGTQLTWKTSLLMPPAPAAAPATSPAAAPATAPAAAPVPAAAPARPL